MLYYLFKYLQEKDIMGAGLFDYITFRASISIIIALIITILFGERLIIWLKSLQVKETVRDLGLAGEKQKQGTPTMGGLIIIAAILVPTLLVAKLDNIYVIMLIVTTLWAGIIGFIDDYIKIFKKNKKGLKGRFKIIGQVGLGLIVGIIMYFHQDVVIRKDITNYPSQTTVKGEVERINGVKEDRPYVWSDYKAPVTDMPFLKTYKFDYAAILKWFGMGYERWAFLIYIPAVIFIITAVSNAANLTDGIDGLATGLSAIAGICLGIFAYVSGNFIISDYLNIMYLPDVGELGVFIAAFIGACIGFLWFNAYPAQVFMGDTGSLTLGAIIATLAIAVRKELLLPLLCGIFVLENLSVIMQVFWFKYTRKKFGEGRRIFLMSPLHHHYQKKGLQEAKIVTRFWIVGIMLAVLTFLTLKIR